MAVPSIQSKPLCYFAKPQEEEESDLKKSDQPEINEMALYVHQLAGEIYQLSLTAASRAQLGQRFTLLGRDNSSHLQTLNLLQPASKKETQCLKQDIAASNLSKISSFAERKIQFARCVQMTDSLSPQGVYHCLEYHSKGLTREQQKALRDFVPKVQVGKSTNELFAPFAALSQLIKFGVKALYLSGVSNGCLENDPSNYDKCVSQLRDTFEGRNPQVNKAVKEALPQWVLKAGQFLARGDVYLKAFDSYMVDQYMTIPGIIHKGVYGMADAALPGAATATVRIAKTALQGIKVAAPAAAAPVARNMIRFAKDEAGSVQLSLIICKDMAEVKAVITADKVNTLAKPWAHEYPLTVNAERKAQDLVEIAQGIAKKYTAEELAQRQLVIRDGLVYQGSSGEVLHTSGNMNIVLRKDGTLLADYKIQPDGSWSYHSALCEDPIAAGNASFHLGKTSYLDEGSGHFLPFNRLQYIEHVLKTQGAQFTEDFYKLTAEQLLKM